MLGDLTFIERFGLVHRMQLQYSNIWTFAQNAVSGFQLPAVHSLMLALMPAHSHALPHAYHRELS